MNVGCMNKELVEMIVSRSRVQDQLILFFCIVNEDDTVAVEGVMDKFTTRAAREGYRGRWADGQEAGVTLIDHSSIPTENSGLIRSHIKLKVQLSLRQSYCKDELRCMHKALVTCAGV